MSQQKYYLFRIKRKRGKEKKKRLKEKENCNASCKNRPTLKNVIQLSNEILVGGARQCTTLETHDEESFHGVWHVRGMFGFEIRKMLRIWLVFKKFK